MLHSALATISLVMSVGLLAPVVADIQEIYAPQGTTKTLSCPCTSSGAETVWYWYKGATLIASSFSLPNDRYVLSNDGHNLTITVTDYDHGTYECKMILALPEIHECTKKFNVSILAVRMEPCNKDSASGNGCECSLNTVEVTEITCSAYGFPNRPTIYFTSSDKNQIASIPSTDDDLWTSTAIIEPTSSGNRVVTCSASLEHYSATTNVCVAATPPPALRMEPCGNPGEGSECACTVDATEEIDITCIASGFLDRPTILFANSEGNPIPSISSSTDSNEWSAVATIEPVLTTENRVVTCSVSSKQPSLTISACLISTSTASPHEKKDKGLGTGGIIGIVFAVIVILLITIGLIACFKKRLSKRATDSMLPYSKKAQGQDELEDSEMIPTTTRADGLGSKESQWDIEAQPLAVDNSTTEVVPESEPNSPFQPPIMKEDKDCDDNANDNEIWSPDDRGEPLVMQIFRDDLKISSDIEIQNDMINTVRGILKEFETGSTTRGSSGSCMRHSSKTTDSEVQKERIRKLSRSTKSRLNRLEERDERHLRDKCELLICQSVVEPQKSAPPELNINEESQRNISNKSQLRPEEINELKEHLEFILKVAVKPDEERYHITQFILAAHEQDRKCQTANTRGSGLSARYNTAVPQQDTPNGRIARFWVEKIMNIGDSNIQFHVFTSICDYV